MWNWLKNHPEMIVHTWPILTALILFIVKSRTPEELAALPVWQRRLVVFVQASGLDVRGVLNAVKPKGAISIPPPPKEPRGFVGRRPLLGLSGVAILALASCSLFNAKNAKTVLDVAQVTCIIANATLADEDVQKVCKVVDSAVPDMRNILGEHRAAASRAAFASAYHCPDGDLDAGPDGN